MTFVPPDLKFDVDVFFDHEANVWCAQCPEAGVFTDAPDLDTLLVNFHEAVELLLEDDPNIPMATVHPRFIVEGVPFTTPMKNVRQTAFA
jgi:hypothetical protein